MSLPPPALARTATTVPGALEKDTGLRYHSTGAPQTFSEGGGRGAGKKVEKGSSAQEHIYDHQTQRFRCQKGLWAAIQEGPTYLPQKPWGAPRANVRRASLHAATDDMSFRGINVACSGTACSPSAPVTWARCKGQD